MGVAKSFLFLPSREPSMVAGTVKIRVVSLSLPPFVRCVSLVLGIAIATVRVAQAAEIELTLQTRDPATGQIVLATEKVGPKLARPCPMPAAALADVNGAQ